MVTFLYQDLMDLITNLAKRVVKAEVLEKTDVQKLNLKDKYFHGFI